MTSPTTDRGPTEAVQELTADPVLAPLVEEYGTLTLDPAEDAFRRLIVAILRQQVSMEAAEAVRERLFSEFEISPGALASADQRDLRDCGLSRQKARYVTNVASAHLEQGYGREYFRDRSDDDVVEELTSITGVGTWTAKMYLMFCLGREDVFPVEDLGIRRSMQALVRDDLSRAEMRERASAWHPYRSIASLYLWRHSE